MKQGHAAGNYRSVELTSTELVEIRCAKGPLKYYQLTPSLT